MTLTSLHSDASEYDLARIKRFLVNKHVYRSIKSDERWIPGDTESATKTRVPPSVGRPALLNKQVTRLLANSVKQLYSVLTIFIHKRINKIYIVKIHTIRQAI